MNQTFSTFFLLALFATPTLASNSASMSAQSLSVIAELRQIKNLKKLQDDDFLAMTEEINASGYEYPAIKPRFLRYLDRGLLPFEALKKAIKAENMHRFRSQYQNLVAKDDSNEFVQAIRQEKISKVEQEKVIKAYSICIFPLQFESARSFLTPIIGKAINDYPEPRHEKYSIKVRTSPSKRSDGQIGAYRLLIAEAQKMAIYLELNEFEKLKMAKCIAEHALGFFQPFHHPLKALGKTMVLESRSPERAYFGTDGVCSNFSAITYNIALALGLEGKLFLARRKFHVYLELFVGKSCYHCHPFNSQAGSYDFLEFPKKLDGSASHERPIQAARYYASS